MFTPWDFHCILPALSLLLPCLGVPAAQGRLKIQATQLVCPACRSSKFRRSRRRTIVDYLLGIGGVLPWRCESCEARFRRRRTPLRVLLYAHCGICGNLELQRIAAEHVTGQTSRIGLLLGLPAYRCVPCRNKFFSIRPLRQEGKEKPRLRAV